MTAQLNSPFIEDVSSSRLNPSSQNIETPVAIARAAGSLPNGRKAHPLLYWGNLVVPQLFNAALTATSIYLGVITANPAMIIIASISGVVQATLLAHSWIKKEGENKVGQEMLFTMFASFGAAVLGRAIGLPLSEHFDQTSKFIGSLAGAAFCFLGNAALSENKH